MMQARWVRQAAAVGGLALLALAFGAPVSAQAQRDDSVETNSIWGLEQRIIGTFARGLGLRDPNAPAIDYRERSPLVVPPSRELPPPQARVTPGDPAWPVDPDVAKARKQADIKRKQGSANARTARENQGTPLTPEQLNPTGSTAPAQSNRSNAPAPGSDPDGRQVAPSELGYFGGLFTPRAWGFGLGRNQSETATFTGEPPRSQLTEPPPGYQVPSPAHPYGTTHRTERTKVQAFDPAR